MMISAYPHEKEVLFVPGTCVRVMEINDTRCVLQERMYRILISTIQFLSSVTVLYCIVLYCIVLYYTDALFAPERWHNSLLSAFVSDGNLVVTICCRPCYPPTVLARTQADC